MESSVPASRKRARSRPGADAQPSRVLVVDDDPAVRLVCSINLELEGFDVLEASDGRSGLAQARSARPDLVLTDVKMPGLDGFQLTEALRRDERTRRVPVIFLSGEPTADNRSRALALGARAYLEKPFDPATVVALVASQLASVDPEEAPAALPNDPAPR